MIIRFFNNFLYAIWKKLEDFETENENRPDLIYKYRNWDNDFHKKILLENSLYLAPPDFFNDPFDCRIYKNFTSLNSKGKIERYINNTLNVADYENLEEFNRRKLQLTDRLKDLKAFQLKSEKVDDKITNSHLGIISFSRRWDSILMWSHYANYHQGLCIGFDERKLRKNLQSAQCGKVIYKRRCPKINPLDNENEVALLKPFYKSNEWKYEKEYRIVTIAINEELNRNVLFPEDCIKEIILGVNIAEKHKKEILKLAKKRNIDIYQAEKIPFKFQLNRTRID